MSDKKYAFTARQSEHKADGGRTTVTYCETILECKECWDKTCYTVPESGIYHFSLSFVRDQQQSADDGKFGSADDTSIDIFVNDKPKATAYAGESSGRQTGTVSVTLELKKCDVVTTKDWNVKAAFRRLRLCYFTGFKI